MSPEPLDDPAVLVFVRAPKRGAVKTRLAAGVGEAMALRIYRGLAEHTVRQARATGAVVRVCVTPDDAVGAVADWLGPGATYLPQGSGTLGDRLTRAFEEAFRAGHAPVIVVGSDLPELSSDLLRRAIARLARTPAVVGPAEDGGYYLLGMNTWVADVFHEIPWSTPSVLRLTLRRMAEQGVVPSLLETLRDVDRAADLPPRWRMDDGGLAPGHER
jgi:uncharacterized protein